MKNKSSWMYPDTKIEPKHVPNPFWHKVMSFIKSSIRVTGYILIQFAESNHISCEKSSECLLACFLIINTAQISNAVVTAETAASIAKKYFVIE